MFDIGFLEIFVIGAIALIVVGPKELPGLLRTVGQYAGKARAMARDFQRTMEDAAKEADLGEVTDIVKGKNNLPFGNQVTDSLKEFQKAVKSEVTDAAKAAEGAVNEAKAAAETSKDAPAETPKVEAPKASPDTETAKPEKAPEAKSA